jgi:hypothetical protein
MKCLIVPRDTKHNVTQFLLKDYLRGTTKFHDISKTEEYTDSYNMAHTRSTAIKNASQYTLQVRKPFLVNVTGTLCDIENYSISINDRGGRLSCTFRSRAGIKVGDIVYMIYTTTKSSKIAGRFEVESVSTTNTATTFSALDTVAILNTMIVSLAIGANIPPEIAIEYLGEQINIPIYVRAGTSLMYSAGSVSPNTRPRDILDNYINSNTTVCLDDLGVIAIKPVDFTDYYITLDACRGDWSLEIQYHEDYLTRTRLLDPTKRSDNLPYWDYGAELLYGKTHATDNEIIPFIYKQYTVGKDIPPTAKWIDKKIHSGEYAIVQKGVGFPKFGHMQASKKRVSYILVAKNLPVCYDLCPGDVVYVCYQYGSDSPKNCLMRVSDITFADDRMTLKGNLHLTQDPIEYAPIQILPNYELGDILIKSMPAIDINSWQLANPNK